MTPSDYLSRFPSARPSTIAFLIKRDAMTKKLKAETNAAKGWRGPRAFRAVAALIRDMWRA